MDQRNTSTNVLWLRSVITGIFQRLFERLVGLDVTDLFSGRIDVTIVHEILLPELDRIHLELLRHQIQLAFIGKEALGIARRTHMAARNLVRVDHVFFDKDVGNIIRPG